MDNPKLHRIASLYPFSESKFQSSVFSQWLVSNHLLRKSSFAFHPARISYQDEDHFKATPNKQTTPSSPNLPANRFKSFLFRILSTSGAVAMLMLMLAVLMMLVLLLLHVIQWGRHGCTGRRRLHRGPRRGMCYRLSNLGHCALIADRTHFVVLFDVSHAGCMSKKVCNETDLAREQGMGCARVLGRRAGIEKKR